jgi:hypothetical protein
MLNVFGAGLVQLNTAALSTSTATANQLSPVGSQGIVIMNNTGGTPGTYTTRTAAQMVADSNFKGGETYLLVLNNFQGTGTLTLAGGSNVTVSGTATVAANTGRIFTVVVNAAATAITITGLAFGFTGNV